MIRRLEPTDLEEFSFHVMSQAGENMCLKVVFDYAWIGLLVNFMRVTERKRPVSCYPPSLPAAKDTGDGFEVVAGVGW
jgi:hypothetical protein